MKEKLHSLRLQSIRTGGFPPSSVDEGETGSDLRDLVSLDEDGPSALMRKTSPPGKDFPGDLRGQREATRHRPLA